MKVARLSSWVFGLGMILIALVIPYLGGIVEVVLSVGAVTGGPLLAPSLWALFSKKLNGKATLWISGSTLAINLIFKILLPIISGFKLSRGEEMILGIGLPLLLLGLNEWLIEKDKKSSEDYEIYAANLQQRKNEKLPETMEETAEIRQQNRFGLQVIAGSLVFTALMLFGLSLLSSQGGGITAAIAVVVLLGAFIPFRAQRVA